MPWGFAAAAAATVVSGVISADAAGKASKAQANAAKDSGALAYKTSQEQIAAAKEALDKQILAAGATVDKQLLAQRDSLDQQLKYQTAMYEQSRADFAPYRESGTANLNQLNTLLGIGGNSGAADYGRFKTADFTPADFEAGKDPGYAFRLSEGLKGLDRQAAARGGLISGNALKAASGFAGEQASQEYTNAFNRFQTIRGNTLSPFQSGAAAGQSAAAMQGASNTAFGNAGANAAAGFGQGATNAYGALGTGTYNALGNYGQNVTGALGAYGTNATNAITGGANATASGYVGAANAINSGISGATNAYYQNKMLDMFRNRSPAMNTPQGGFNSGYEANAGVNFAGPGNYG